MKKIVTTCVVLLWSVASLAQQMVSSNPAHLATNVDLLTEISFTFDKPLNVEATVSDSGTPLAFLAVAPEDSLTFDESSIKFSNDNKTFSVSALHKANTFYTWVLTGAVFADGDSVIPASVIRYTTAEAFSGVSVSGSVSSFDGVSRQNIVVALLDGNPFGPNQNKEPDPVAVALSSENGDFTIPFVPNGTYWPVAIVDVDGNSDINHGDFMGIFDPLQTGEPQSIEINSSNVGNVALELKLVDSNFNMPEFVSARTYFDAVKDSALAISTNHELVFAGMFIFDDTLQSAGIAPGWFYSFHDSVANKFLEVEAFDGKVNVYDYTTMKTSKVRSGQAKHKIPSYVLAEEWNPRPVVENWIDSDIAAQVALQNGAQNSIDNREMPVVFMNLMGEYHLFNETNDIVSAWRYEIDSQWYSTNPDSSHDQPFRGSDSFWIDASNGSFIRFDSGQGPMPGKPLEITNISLVNYQTGVPLSEVVSISFSDKIYFDPEYGFPDVEISSPDVDNEPLSLQEWYFSNGDSTLNLRMNFEADTDYSLIIEGAMSVNYAFLDSVYIRNFTTSAQYGERKISGRLINAFEEGPMMKWLEKKATPRLNEHQEPYLPASPIVVLANQNPFGPDAGTARILMASQATFPGYQYELNNVRSGSYYPLAYIPFVGMGEDEFIPFFFIYDTDNDGYPDPIQIGETDENNIDLMWVDFFVLASSTARTYVDRAKQMATEVSSDYALKYVYAPSLGPNDSGRSVVWYYIFYSESQQETIAVAAEPFGDLYIEYGFEYDFDSLFGFFDIFGEEEDPYIYKKAQEFDSEKINEARVHILKARSQENSFVQAEPTLVDTFIDSDVAVTTALENGGALFIEENFVLLSEMVAGYSTDFPDNTSGVWRITYYSIGFEGIFDITYFEAFIDAETGEFLGAQSAPLFDVGGMEVIESNIADFTPNMDLNTTISLRFSQAILPFDEWEEVPVVVISPNEYSGAQLNNWYLSDSDSTINFDVTLADDTDYSLVIMFAVGKDGGVLATPYTLNFSTYDQYGTTTVSGNVKLPEMMPGGPGNQPGPGMGPMSSKVREALADASQMMVNFEDGILVGLMSDSPEDEGGNIVYASKTSGTDLNFALNNVRPGEYFPFAFASSGLFFDDGGMEMFFVYRENGRPAKITIGDSNVENLTLEMFVSRDDNGMGHNSEAGRDFAEEMAMAARNQMRLQFMASDGHVDSLGNSPGWVYVFAEENYDSLAIIIQTPFGDSLFFASHEEAGAPRSNRYLPGVTLSSNQAMNKAHELMGRNFLATYPNAFVEMMAGDIPIGVDGVRHQNLAWITIFYPNEDVAKSLSNNTFVEKLAFSNSIAMENDIKIVSLDVESGDVLTMGTSTSNELDAEIPKSIVLEQNFPNPFNPTTQIEFSLPQAMHVKLNVYDVLGRNVASLTNGLVAAGKHTMSFDARALSSGLYIYQLEAGNTVITKKMMLMK